MLIRSSLSLILTFMGNRDNDQKPLYNILETRLQKYEQKLGRVFLAIIVGFVLLLLAAIYVKPATKTVVHGSSYARLSAAPFDFENA
ncbi:MAG: hypothetical protein V3T31_00370, partial [candidate division Zixibacteria bacterium]